MLENMMQGKSEEYKEKVRDRIKKMEKYANGKVETKQIFALVMMYVDDLELHQAKTTNPLQ